MRGPASHPARWPAFLGAFAAAFDNFAMTPLVKAIALDMKVDLAQATAVASAYFLAYGLLQVPWGLVSERLGRVLVMRLGLIAGLIGAIASVFASTLDQLLVARFIAGAGMASVVPSVIAWLGEVLPADQRGRAATDMNAAYALGAASGVLGAGLLADRLGWAWGFGASGVLAAFSLVGMNFLLAPPRPAVPGELRQALRVPAVRALAVIALVEGAVLFGLFVFLAPTLLASGASAGLTGGLIAAYGVSVVIWARVSAWLSGRIPLLRAMSFGGALLVIGWAAVAISPAPAGVLTAAVLMGATIVFFHANLQVWASQAAPHARGPAIAMFSGSLFVGASLGTALARPLFAAGEVRWLFAIGAALAAVVVVGAVMARLHLSPSPVGRGSG
ncbi:MAG: MFS transporter [Archangium sp.]|nr:MFS transporter [Archangium sp.]MDP3157543.1 MFS transporter [Archangium sp.]MDP3574307.1 MFS transporter [Archangium sp.]